MATAAQWFEGARPRTFPNAIAPVIAGTGAAGWLDQIIWWKAALALVVSVALIIGVNFANDYSDGIRGTDDDRVGPMRLVGSKAASPKSVKTAAIAAFGSESTSASRVSANRARFHFTTAGWLPKA